MITELKRFIVADDRYVSKYEGLSTDTKPTGKINGSQFDEMDTGTSYLYDEDNNLWYAQPKGGSEAQGIFVGLVVEGGSFPTTRPDGSELQNEDYVRPDPTSEFPFTIGTITFNSSKDKAYYMSGAWYLEAGILQDTKETPLAEPTEESYDEDELLANQYQVNKTVMQQLRENLIESEDLDSIDTDKIVKRIYHQTEDTEARDKGLYWYNADSEEEDKWKKVGSADIMPYEYITPVGDIDNSYMAEVSYTDLDYAFADEHYQNNITNFGACSTIVKDGKLIRNYDWKYSNSCGFVVRTPKINNRHAVFGLVGQVDGLTKDFVKSGKYSDMYKIVPFALTDGQNDMGLKASILVVPNDKGNTTGTLASGKRINALMFIRYILDHYASVEEVKQATQNEISIFVPQVMRDLGYEVHFVIADNKESYVLEFVNNACKWTETNKATNFFIDGTTFKSDGTIAVIGDSDIADYGLTEHAEGLERYNILVNHSGTDEQLVEALKYSQLYTLDTNKWYSELCSGDLQITSPMADFESAMTIARNEYATRSRDTALTDHTVHSVIYGKDSVKIYTQENYTVSYEFDVERDVISSDRVELVNGEVESFSGEAETQAEVNKEIVDELKFLESKPDVVDIVQCYDRGTDTTKTDIVHYDLDTVLANDIVKVLIDETHDGKVSYYKVIESGTPAVKSFNYIGSDKPVEVDDLTLNKDANGKVQMKDKGHDFTKIKDAAIGAGLEKSTDGTKIQHSNSVDEETTGKGSASKSLTVKWDAQGHITEIEENDIDFDGIELTTATGTLTAEQKAILEKSNGSYIFYDGNILRKDRKEEESMLGTWVFNDVLQSITEQKSWDFNFRSNNIDYTNYLLKYTSATVQLVCYSNAIEFSNVYAFAQQRWINDAFKTIEITSEPEDEECITWLKANATKQSSNDLYIITYSSDDYIMKYDSITGEYEISDRPQGGGVADTGQIGEFKTSVFVLDNFVAADGTTDYEKNGQHKELYDVLTEKAPDMILAGSDADHYKLLDMRDKFVKLNGTALQTGGEKTHKLTVSEMPSHSHYIRVQGWGGDNSHINATSSTSGTYGSENSEYSGGDQPHNNEPQYITMIPQFRYKMDKVEYEEPAEYKDSGYIGEVCQDFILKPNWLPLNDATVEYAIADYQELYNKLNTDTVLNQLLLAGSDAEHFKLKDISDKFLKLGTTAMQSGGEKTHKLTVSEMPAHTHMQKSTNNPGYGQTTAQLIAGNTVGQLAIYDYIETGSKGSNTAHNNEPQYLTTIPQIRWRRDKVEVELSTCPFPVNSVYMSMDDTNPSALWEGTTWERVAQGKTLIGVDENDSTFNTVGKTGGEKTHTLTTNEMPAHKHTVNNGLEINPWLLDSDSGFNIGFPNSSSPYGNIVTLSKGSTTRGTPIRTDSVYLHNHNMENAGGNSSHNNLQPYITCYMWKRLS